MKIIGEHVPLLAMAGFLVATLFVGFWKSRQVSSFQQYALAGRKVGTGMIVMMILATFMDAGWMLQAPGVILDSHKIMMVAGVVLGQFMLLALWVAVSKL